MTRFISEFLQGLMIGAGAILPGISGASLAVVFGVYEAFLELVAHPFKNIRKFLVLHSSLCAGIGIGFAAFTLLIDHIFSAHTVPLVFLFAGFIAGTLPGIYKNAKKHGLGMGEILAFCVTAGTLAALAIVHHRAGGLFSGQHAAQYAAAGAASPGVATPGAASADIARAGVAAAEAKPLIGSGKQGFLTWFLAGAIIGTGSLLPGLSASFILILLGLYGPLLVAVGNLNLPVAAALGAGVVSAFVLFSRLIDLLYRHFRSVMSFAVLGFTAGSLVLAFPGFPAGTSIPVCVGLFLAGFASAFFLDRSA